MGYLQSTSTSSGVSSHLYSQALQMKLYQAFIFSIPILFSVILFLLFYLFYLKRTFRSINTPSSASVLHSTTSVNSTLPQYSEMDGLRINLEDKLTVILFDEDLYAKDLMCCVCLGEFEMNEKLHQIPSCQHMFHGECIRNWLHSNITCPLCRCSVVNTTKDDHHEPPMIHEPSAVVNTNLNSQGVPSEHSVVIFEGSSSSSMDIKCSIPTEDSVVVNIHINDS
ncbi:probable E3 ubiquitin-protein ligase RHA4A [Rutidosis leptorrhynchoides]|uniref:probable E3 ubiquitin-protein ligase RHA4A n=1 Tax=Rutidosis leptorrhynchoides TaxID=125765 RepID=UPI003A9A29CF